MVRILIALILTFGIVISPVQAKENQAPPKQAPKQEAPAKPKVEKKESTNVEIPSSVVDISKENTYPNPSQNEPELQPSSLTKTLLNTANVDIENPTLIRMLNESNIHTSKWSIGYHARIYLGKWPLNYESKKTTVNWEYKKVNENRVDNRGGIQMQPIKYNQERQVKIRGGLTASVANEKEVKKLMLLEASQNTELPIGFSTIVGYGTKIDRVYNVEPKKVGHLYGFVPAVNEKGKVTYGEVYLVLDGGKKRLEVKNITQQGIGAWMTVQDHIALRYFSTK
jgi:hypothetical protein